MELICSVILFLFAVRNLSEVEGAADTECSPILDKFIRRGRCRYCQACDEGRGRNFTLTVEQIMKLDNTKCLPCEKCPDGSFNDKQDFKNTCRPCTNDKCYKLNREIQRRCKSTSDQICGSCNHGYNDDFHRDHKQPCYKDTQSTSTIVNTLPISTPQQENIGQLRVQDGQKTNYSKYLIFGVTFIGFCIVFAAVMFFIYRRRQERGARCSDIIIDNNVCALASSTMTFGSEFSSLIEGQSLQTDGSLNGDRKQKKIHPNVTQEVRGELHSHYVPTQNGMYASVQQSDQRAENDEPLGKCGCSVAQCSPACEMSSTDDHVVHKEHPILNLIACKICHAPENFFDALEIEHSEIYNLEDNRSRAPEKFSQKEFIRSVLNRWVEIKGQNATCGRIRKALCVGGFHRINTIYSRDNDFGIVE